MKTNHAYHQQQTKTTAEIQIETPNGTKIKADGNTTYVLIGVGGVVLCFFIYMKFHKHVRGVFSRRKK